MKRDNKMDGDHGRKQVHTLAEEEGAVVLDLHEALGLESLGELGPGLLGSSASDRESEDDADEEGTHGCVREV